VAGGERGGTEYSAGSWSRACSLNCAGATWYHLTPAIDQINEACRGGSAWAGAQHDEGASQCDLRLARVSVSVLVPIAKVRKEGG